MPHFASRDRDTTDCWHKKGALTSIFCLLSNIMIIMVIYTCLFVKALSAIEKHEGGEGNENNYTNVSLRLYIIIHQYIDAQSQLLHTLSPFLSPSLSLSPSYPNTHTHTHTHTHMHKQTHHTHTCTEQIRQTWANQILGGWRDRFLEQTWKCLQSVSYTHLTLPTKLSV